MSEIGETRDNERGRTFGDAQSAIDYASGRRKYGWSSDLYRKIQKYGIASVSFESGLPAMRLRRLIH